MKVIKPRKLGVLTRCYERERRFFMGFSVLTFVPLGLDALGPILLSEIDMWKFSAARLGGGTLDGGIPKARAEFLVVGNAHAPGGAPLPEFSVRAQVGGLSKDIQVFGDRRWRGMTASEPEPFVEMPLDWAHAYGGPGFDRNPPGKGHAEIADAGRAVWPLPNLVRPHEKFGSRGARPEPVGFGAMDISWPQRSGLAGTHDRDWLENLFPGFARDVDWGIHNLAQRDQQREGCWAGGEPYRFDGMHPRGELSGALPRLRARVFISRSHGPGEPRKSFVAVTRAARQPPAALEEVELGLQTLWFFPDAERAVLIWHGSTLVAEEDGADVMHLVVAAEHLDRGKPAEHYAAALAARLDPEWGALAASFDDQLLPEDLASLPDQPPEEDVLLNTVEGLAQQNLHRRMTAETQKARDIVASHGLDPDVHGPQLPPPLAPPPKLHELPDVVAKIQAEAKARQAESEAMAAAKLAEAERDVDEAKIPGFDGKALRQQVHAKQVGPPTFTAAGQRAMLVRLAMESRQRGTIVDQIEDMIADKSLYAQWEEAEHKMREGYRLTAHYQQPAPPVTSELRAPTRERVRLAIDRREDFSTLNFTGAELSGMDLRGADMTGALFESADLSGADLRGCKLGRAVLAHANLTDTRLDEAMLGGANLGKAILARTVLAGAELREAIFSEARFVGADLQRARVTGATWMGAQLEQLDARGMTGEQLNLIDVKIVRADFGGARLSGANFVKLDLRGASFAGAVLTSCNFVECDLSGVDFLGADLSQARFVGGCLLDAARLGGATLKRAFLRGSSMRSADLREAVLDTADLSECDLAEATFQRAVARDARFEVADLRGATLVSANLMGASLARAALEGADLRDANLHGADMARVRQGADVRLEDSLRTRVRVHPRHVEPPRGERRG